MIPVMAELKRTAEAAHTLGVSAETLRRWARAGRVVPATRTLGGQDRWDIKDLRRQVDEATSGDKRYHDREGAT